MLLPAQMDGYAVESVVIDDAYRPAVSYSVRWRRADGACAEVLGSNDGLGGPEYPIVSAEVTLASLPGQPRYRVYKAADDPASSSAENWGPGTVVSDYVEAGDIAVWLLSNDEDGCTPLALEEGAAVLASLRPLFPGMLASGTGGVEDGALDGGALGAFMTADDVIEASPEGTTPEAAVQAFVAGWEATGVDVETLSQSSQEARVLATMTGLADDSVRDERILFVFERDGGRWVLADAGRQVRCHPGRGHADWSAELCL